MSPISKLHATSNEFCSAIDFPLYSNACGSFSAISCEFGTPEWSTSCINADNTIAKCVNGSLVIPIYAFREVGEGGEGEVHQLKTIFLDDIVIKTPNDRK